MSYTIYNVEYALKSRLQEIRVFQDENLQAALGAGIIAPGAIVFKFFLDSAGTCAGRR
ncbi:hypothetical protein A2U01_0040655, partial [Trifolium medium]|nr:hypothetical protein [Trifolium medium]